MVIGERFIWAHLGRTAGDVTTLMFECLPHLITFAHKRGDSKKHMSFQEAADELRLDLKSYRKLMNIRRLPSWLLSRVFMAKKDQPDIWLDDPPSLEAVVEGYTPSGDGRELIHADDRLRWMGAELVDHWIRMEHLVNDFLCVIGRFARLSEEEEKQLVEVGSVKSELYLYDRDLEHWFTEAAMEKIYQSCPLWREIEQSVYGDTLVG